MRRTQKWATFLLALSIVSHATGFNDAINHKESRRASHAGERLHHAPHRTHNNHDLVLVVVIASGSKPCYKVMRPLWRMIGKAVAPLGVHVYLTGKSVDVTEPSLNKDGDTIVFPGKESFEPGILEASIDCADFVIRHKLPGHNAKYYLRTNMSTFWAFSNFVKWLANKPRTLYAAGTPYGLEIPYPAGTGIVMSMDLVHTMIQERSSLRYDKADDLAFGYFLLQHNITFENMPRDNTYEKNAEAVPFEFDTGTFNWRVNYWTNQTQDVAIWASMFVFWYGPDMELWPLAGVRSQLSEIVL